MREDEMESIGMIRTIVPIVLGLLILINCGQVAVIIEDTSQEEIPVITYEGSLDFQFGIGLNVNGPNIPVYFILDGQVLYVSVPHNEVDLGKHLITKHNLNNENHYYILYSGLGEIFVSSGDLMSNGDILGLTASEATGRIATLCDAPTSLMIGLYTTTDNKEFEDAFGPSFYKFGVYWYDSAKLLDAPRVAMPGWEHYIPSSIAEVTAEGYEHSLQTPDGESSFWSTKFRADLVYGGQVRDINDTVKGFISLWGMMMGVDQALINVTNSEVLFRESLREYWIPFQDELLEDYLSLQEGQEIEQYLIYIGYNSIDGYKPYIISSAFREL